MAVVAELSAVAWPPPLIVSVTVLVAVEITEMDPVYPLPTHTWDPSGVAAIDIGSPWTAIEPVTRPVAVEITSTEFEFSSATYTVEPEGVIVTEYGSAPAATTPRPGPRRR